MEYKKKVLTKILEKTEAEIIPQTEESTSTRFLNAFIGLGAIKAFSAGDLFNAPNQDDSFDAMAKSIGVQEEIKEKYCKEGGFVDDGVASSLWLWDENVIGGHTDQLIRFDPNDPFAVEQGVKYIKETERVWVDKNFGVPMMEGTFSLDGEVHEIAGPKMLNYHIWMKKIKKAFDPNLVSDSSWYISP